MVYKEKMNYREENITFFKLKPDIVLENEKEIIILDTKWKELKNSKKNEVIYNFGISEKDIYQMITYIHVYNSKVKNNDSSKFCNKAYLIYPINNNNSSSFIENIVFSGKDGLEIRAYFIDLSSEEKTKESLENILKLI